MPKGPESPEEGEVIEEAGAGPNEAEMVREPNPEIQKALESAIEGIPNVETASITVTETVEPKAGKTELTPQVLEGLKERLDDCFHFLGSPMKKAVKALERYKKGGEKIEMSVEFLDSIAHGVERLNHIEDLDIAPERLDDTKLRERLSQALTSLHFLEEGVQNLREERPDEIQKVTTNAFRQRFAIDESGRWAGVLYSGNLEHWFDERERVLITFGTDEQLHSAIEQLDTLRGRVPEENWRDTRGSFQENWTTRCTMYWARIDGAKKRVQKELDRRAAK